MGNRAGGHATGGGQDGPRFGQLAQKPRHIHSTTSIVRFGTPTDCCGAWCGGRDGLVFWNRRRLCRTTILQREAAVILPVLAIVGGNLAFRAPAVFADQSLQTRKGMHGTVLARLRSTSNQSQSVARVTERGQSATRAHAHEANLDWRTCASVRRPVRL